MNLERDSLIISRFIALAVFLVGIAFLLLFAGRGRRRVQRRLEGLRDPVEGEEHGVDATIVRDMSLSSIPALDRFLSEIPAARRLQTLLTQADMSIRVGTFSLLTLLLATVGGFLAAQISGWLWAFLPGALLLGVIPFLVAWRKKEKRRRMFERQFPDALDLITGALRSGMAFTGALQVVAEETPDPVATEFQIVFEEQRLGLTLREALEGMTVRVDSTELRLFVTAVLIQRETGGNLAEVLEGAADVIRDRFRILGDVRTITAQARFSGAILTILPLVMAGILVIMARDYMMVLVKDPIGPYLIITAIVLQLIGFIAIRKIIRIKV